MTLNPSLLVISNVEPAPAAVLGLAGDVLLAGGGSVGGAPTGGTAEPPPHPANASPSKATTRELLRSRRPAAWLQP